ncbi:GPR1/FUN34/YaaH family transporter [Streptomyces sp. V3I7]|uniref:GPR1/FUN34/YaaH family transporter n=1 Tax=Streptomyces sp. V3I7 TaxID=3042278 RepID=UPI0027843D7A|nr:GPR1/FUN34/YaaH family transporter [Streptomyces sp. V3I7]MDQ0991055.1 succinate-acetate transporter protein [Streptomyces sp. V3I7]
MTNDVSAGSGSITVAGRLALGVTLLAFGLGTTGVIDGVAASDAVTLAHYVGGVALFLLGLVALRDRDGVGGTGFAALGALWFTWAVADRASAEAAGLFLLLFALVALTLTLAGGDTLGQAVHGLLFLAMLLLAVASFAGSSSLAKAGGWVAVLSGAVAWYAATAALAHWPTALPRRAAGRGVTAAG